MKKTRPFPRFVCIFVCAVLLAGTASISCGPGWIDTFRVPEASGSPVTLQTATQYATEAVQSVPYVANAAMGELRGIVAYALGEDPTAGKAITDPGQNTKNNVAISLLKIRDLLRGVRSARFVLEPYEGSQTVSELCVYRRFFLRKGEDRVRTGMLYDDSTQTISSVDGTGMMGIGYNFNYAFNTFSAASDPWQRNFGFCRAYDSAAFLIGDVYETIRVPFRYGGKDWMIQIWKGIYSWNMLGGEIGLYNKPIDRKEAFYDCATDVERLPISFAVLLGDETIVETDCAPSWWQTAFTIRKTTLPKKLTMQFTLQFPDAQMLSAFSDSLQNVRPDVVVQQKGLTLLCIWNGK